jgi:hypothetical protein
MGTDKKPVDELPGNSSDSDLTDADRALADMGYKPVSSSLGHVLQAWQRSSPVL